VDNSRCCKNSFCVIDDNCNCPGCVLEVSIDDDPAAKKYPQFSRHVGIINFFPIMFGLVTNNTRLSNSLDTLSDPD
jgi:mannosyl-oligosaccharide glucosidase